MSDNGSHENREAWREAAGERVDSLWRAFEDCSPPPFPRQLRQAGRTSVWKLATAASLAGCMVLAGFLMQTQNRVDALAVQLAMNQLQSETLSTQLRASNALRHHSRNLSTETLTQLGEIMGAVDDPNVQLEILEILVESGAVKTQDDLRLSPNVSPSRASFIRASYAQLYSSEARNDIF